MTKEADCKKVRIEYTDRVVELNGEQAEKWSQHLSVISHFAFLHGLRFPKLNFKVIEKVSKSVTKKRIRSKKNANL